MCYNEEISISVVLPTYNGKEFLKNVLDSIFSQKFNGKFEVLIIDSGSTDGTLKILENYNIILYQIKKNDFGHGKTRNLGVELANGEIILFITQDAVPIGDNWLQTCLDSFEYDKSVVCVYGRHIPRVGVNPFIAKDINLHFEGLGTEQELRIDFINPRQEGWEFFYKNYGVLGFNSNVCSALRKSFALRHPFENVEYAEDQLMGRNVIRYGYKKVYSSKFIVEHSHEYPLYEYFKRYFDEYRGLRDTLNYIDSVQLRSVIFESVYATYKDMQYITSNKMLHKNVISTFFWGVVYHVFRRLGAYLGGRFDRLPIKIRKYLSKEGRA